MDAGHSDAGGEAVHVTFKSSVLDEQEMAALCPELLQLIDEKGCRWLLLDLRHVRWLNSSVLGSFIALHNRLRDLNGKLELCNVNRQVYEVLELTQLNRLFTLTLYP